MEYLIVIVSCLQLSQCSYLGYPRIHFAGQFRADSDTRNNDPCNYDPNIPLNPNTNLVDWGFNGTNDFQFFDTEITSVVYSDGSNSTSDAVVGREIIGNLERPFAKLVDLDVDCQQHSTVYGLNFGVRWSDDQPTKAADIAFYGKWTRSVVAQSMWLRLKCYSDSHYGSELYQDSFPLGAQSTTRITDITWGDTSKSRALQELQSAAAGENLTVRLTFFYYTRNYPTYVPFNATLGYVIGVIGVPSENDTLNVPGERTMTPTGKIPDIIYNDPNDLCYEQNLSTYSPWMYDAPFEVDYSRNEVRFDLSNSIPANLDNMLRNIGTLRLGVYFTTSSCVYLLGDDSIPYDSNTQLDLTSGIYTVKFDSSLRYQIAIYPLVIVQYLQGDSGNGTKICGESIPVPTSETHTARILLLEPEFFVRPRDYYVERVEHQYNPYASQILYVTRYGVPAANAGVLMSRDSIAPPLNGVTPRSFFVRSDSRGYANFSFAIQTPIPYPRQYTRGISCSNGQTYHSLPIDGQVYYFTYCVNSTGGTKVECQNSGFTIVFLAFSQVNYTRPYTWVDDVGPILSQYARLSKIMDNILNMSNYTAVTQYHNLRLLNLSLSLDFDDPSYMPTTRDLSNVKRNMILEWLANPLYNSAGTKPPVQTAVCIPPATQRLHPKVSEITPRCFSTHLPFTEHPSVLEPYYKQLYDVDEDTDFKLRKRGIPGRPLLGRIHKKMKHSKNMKRFREMPEPTCNRANVVTQLQTAVQLEWATIPTYLTSLYSIVEGCNTEIYELIRSVVMQEMLHFTQSANILIAMGETPIIDDASVTPGYPTYLPGGVLPLLKVHLKKLSLEHVHVDFMGIEVPQETEVAGNLTFPDLYTIGVFYQEIADCIVELGDSIFNPSTLPFQVNWPWNPTNQIGYLVPVINASTATSGIEMIIAQGEGAGLLDPNDIGNHTLAHFFKFEEIVCQHQLEAVYPDNYAYIGASIPFLAEGVWPMRDNPSKDGILPHTNCYTESRVFHQAYRALLRKLQEVFSGSPEEISQAVTIMESLQVHAKKLMWTKYRPSNEADDTTCGPVWDYDWPEN